MPNKIQIKRTSVTGRTPNTTSSGNSSFIDTGELALNITDGKLFSSNGLVSFEVGANLNSLSVGGAKLTANATLVNAVALNVVNQTNTGTLFVTTSANVGTAFTANSSLVNAIALNVVNDLNVGGNISLGDSSSDSITINGTIQPGVVISGSANAAALRITQTSTGTGALALRVEDQTNPDSSPFIIDAAGRVRIGTSTEFNEKLVLFSNDVNIPEPSIVLRNQYPGANGPNIYFDKQRNLGDPLVILDDLGSIQFRGLQEFALPQVGAIIRAEVDSSAEAGFMPSTLRFSVTPNSPDADPIERLTISGLNNNIVANTNVQVIGTLAVANGSTDTVMIGSEPWDPGTLNTYAVIGRTYSGTLSHHTLTTMAKLQNVAVSAARNHIGDRVYMMNESQNRSAGGTLYNTLVYGFRADVFNGNSAIGGDARVQALYGINTEVANYANGSNANTVQLGIGAQFEYASRGSGITENAYGVVADVGAGNNSITGNINFAYGIKPVIRSNTGMTITNGYLFYGTHAGSTTINKYGLYLENEGNNYISGNVYVAGAIRPIGGIVANGSIGSAGQVLTSNSTGVYWSAVTGTAANPGGATTQVQFNDGGTFGATAGFTFNKTTNNVTVGNTITVGAVTSINSTTIALDSFGTTNGALITTTSIDVGNTTANAALDYNIIYVANNTSRANLTPTTLAIGSITVNSALANLQALNVVNQTNTATIFVTTSANVASAFLANSTGAYHTGTVNAASHTVGTNFTSNSSQLVLNAPSYTVSFSNTNGSAINYITWGQSLQQAIPATTTRSLGTKIIFYEGLSGSATDWAYGLAGSEMWASVGTTTGTFRWYAVTTAFMTSNTSYLNHNAQVRVGGGVGTTNGATISNTSITVGNSTINTTANSTTILVNGVDLVATQKRAIAMSMIFGR